MNISYLRSMIRKGKEEAEEAVISRRDEGMPTADAVQVVVELRRYRNIL